MESWDVLRWCFVVKDAFLFYSISLVHSVIITDNNIMLNKVLLSILHFLFTFHCSNYVFKFLFSAKANILNSLGNPRKQKIYGSAILENIIK